MVTEIRAPSHEAETLIDPLMQNRRISQANICIHNSVLPSGLLRVYSNVERGQEDSA